MLWCDYSLEASTMITEVVLTGTGYPRPHPDRAGPGALVRRGDCVLQFDAGRGTVMTAGKLGHAADSARHKCA